jgi:hypothetical protein
MTGQYNLSLSLISNDEQYNTPSLPLQLLFRLAFVTVDADGAVSMALHQVSGDGAG